MVDSRYGDEVDHGGQTLIPPTLRQFANTFQVDLKSVLGLDLKLTQGEQRRPNTIFITLDNSTDFHDAAGRFTSEGYGLLVDGDGVVVTGASPLGAWWATRTIIQAAVTGNSTLPRGSGVDAPGWGTRGAMVSLNSYEITRIDQFDIARCRASLLPTRLPGRDVLVSLVLQTEYLPLAPQRQSLQQRRPLLTGRITQPVCRIPAVVGRARSRRLESQGQ